jgi:hypothetical protein
MERGRQVHGSVLVLAYVFSLMNDSDRDFAKSWPGPIIEIDARSFSLIPGTVPIGPNAFAKGLSMREWPVVKSVEGKFESTDTVLFSENLLRLPSISYDVLNPSVTYYRAMRPFASAIRCRVPEAGDSHTFVVHDLFELANEWRYSTYIPIYLGTIGRVVANPVFVNLTLLNNFMSCVVYATDRNTSMVSSLRGRVPYAFMGPYFLFCSPSDCVVNLGPQGYIKFGSHSHTRPFSFTGLVSSGCTGDYKEGNDAYSFVTVLGTILVYNKDKICSFIIKQLLRASGVVPKIVDSENEGYWGGYARDFLSIIDSWGGDVDLHVNPESNPLAWRDKEYDNSIFDRVLGDEYELFHDLCSLDCDYLTRPP